MESNKIKVRNGSQIRSNSRTIKVIDLYKNPNSLITRRKRVTTSSRGAAIKKIEAVQIKYLNNPYTRGPKRVFDIVISSLVIIFVLSWLYPLLFILIKSGSKGPVLFKQKRNGLNQDHFECLKFRSMEINEYCDSVPTVKHDPRITRIGYFIRRYNIDEMPQFINVIKGEMSVVGPRPHMISETNQFNKVSDDFYKRHLVKPGITGLAQISNCRGQINSVHDLSNRIKYDLFYIRKASVGYDLIILYKTAINMIFGDPKAV